MASADDRHLREVVARSLQSWAPTPRFPQSRPISLNVQTLDTDTARRVIAEYSRSGYAVVRCDPHPDDGAELLKLLAEQIGLGRPFVPALYSAGATGGSYDDSGVNVITTAANNGTASHPAFGSADAIEFHTDGTLEPIGYIRTAALYCAIAAQQGGRTTLFNAVGAFAELALREPALVDALLHGEALTRRTTVGDAPKLATGPVFAVRDGEILSRYSITPRDHWAVDRVGGLDAVKQALAELARPGSPYYAELVLEPGDAILIANDKLSHGRTAFVDSPESRRRMLRALFLDRPAGEPAIAL